MAGLALLLGGMATACYYFFYFDTSVTVPGGEFIGVSRINNIGLISQRQNGIVFSIGASLLGCLLIFLGRDSTKGIAASEKKCPYCAELIKVDAKICRYCSREIGTSG
jgi:hypothetical protein